MWEWIKELFLVKSERMIMLIAQDIAKLYFLVTMIKSVLKIIVSEGQVAWYIAYFSWASSYHYQL